MRSALALAASAAALAGPAVAGAGGTQEGGVAQVSAATAVAAVVAPTSGAVCLAGCPTIVVATPVAVAFSFNLAALVQLLNESLRP